MRRAIRRCVEVFAECFEPSGPVVELGARYEPGYAWLGDMRPLFPGRPFIGCDIRQGPGVDRLEDAEQLRLQDASAGTVLLFEVLEHLRHPHRAVAEVRRILRPDGLLAVSVPFHYRIHGFPSDYWRFTAAGVQTLLADFGGSIVCDVGPRLKPAFIFAIATPEPSQAFEMACRRFPPLLEATMRRRRARGMASVLKERARDLFGALIGRGELGVRFFDPSQPARYARDFPARPPTDPGT